MDVCSKFENSKTRWFAVGVVAVLYIPLFFISTDILHLTVYIPAGIALCVEVMYEYHWTLPVIEFGEDNRVINFKEYKSCMFGAVIAYAFLALVIYSSYSMIEVMANLETGTYWQSVVNLSCIVTLYIMAVTASFAIGKLTGVILLEHYFEWNK